MPQPDTTVLCSARTRLGAATKTKPMLDFIVPHGLQIPVPLLDAIGCTDRRVRTERQDRRLAGVHLPVDAGLKARAVFTEHLLDVLVALLASHRIEIDDGAVHFRVDIDRRDGDEIETFVMRAVGDAEFHPSLTGTDNNDESVRQSFLGLWQKLSPQDQLKALPRLVREVVYDPKRSRITMTLDPDVVVQMAQPTG